MPAIPAPTLAKYRATPHSTKMYMVVQQPIFRTSGLYSVWDGYVWSGTVAGVPSNPDTSLSVTSNGSFSLVDGMTVLVGSSEYGGRDRGVFRVHGDQTIGAGAESLYIHESSELGSIQIGDYVVVLDEFRLWSRYPKVTESGGNLTFYKDYGFFRDSLITNGLLWTHLGVNDATRREALYPPVPIMGTHRVEFLDVGGTVDVDFDWSDSYAMSPGATVNSWSSSGEDGLGGWASAVENPPAQTYSQLSGQAGYRVTLEVESDVTDPIIEFRRGVRYVFTLRRPEDYQDGIDPLPKSHYTPITDFELSGVSGDFSSGQWRTSVRIYSDAASQYEISPQALVIVFTEDYYSGTQEELGPVAGSENILFIGHIADGTITQDDETGDTVFDVISIAEQASKRESYPVPIENDDNASSWIQGQDLTVSRAAWWFLAWHTTMPLITDIFAQLTLDGADDTREIEAQDFLSGDIFRSSIDSFLQDRAVGRILADRYDRVALVIDRQVQTSAGADTLFTLDSGDWVRQISLRERNERPVNLVEAGGVNWNAGTITPYLSIAPGFVSGYIGISTAPSKSLAITGQAQLNTVSGRLYAYRTNTYPQLVLQMAGNWRHGDIWPQQYVNVTLVTDRVTLTSQLFILRGVSYSYNAQDGFISTTFTLEAETDGPDGVTVPILSELAVTTGEMATPPQKPPGFGGTALVATDDGIWLTRNLYADDPTWEELNDGLTSALYANNAREVYALVEDPNNPGEWWAGTADGVYYNDDLLGTGTWVQLLSLDDIDTITTVTSLDARGIAFSALKPGYAAVCGTDTLGNIWIIDNNSNGASSTVGDWRGRGIGADDQLGAQQLAVSDHLNAGNTDVRCVLLGIEDTGYLFLDDTGDTSGAFTNDVDPGTNVYPVAFWESPTYDDDSGFLSKSGQNGVAYVQLTSAFLDAGPGTTVSKGDAGMVTPSNVHGVLLWVDIENVFWFTADDAFIWYSNDAGTTWSNWGDDFSGEFDSPGAADGDTGRGFIIASLDSNEPASPIVIIFNPDNDVWQDKTGNLDDDSAARNGYRIYLLDE